MIRMDLAGMPTFTWNGRTSLVATALAPDHAVPAHAHAGQHRRVVGDANVVLQHRAGVGDVLLLHDAVGVAVDVGVVRDAHPVAQGDPPAVVQQDVAVHHDVVPHLEVVPVGKFGELEALEVSPAAREEMGREQATEADAQVHVLPAEGRAVEAVPEPEERLHPREARLVHVGVVLGLEGDVAGIERQQGEPAGHRGPGIGEPLIVVAVAGVVELVEDVAGQPRPVRPGLGQAALRSPPARPRRPGWSRRAARPFATAGAALGLQRIGDAGRGRNLPNW